MTESAQDGAERSTRGARWILALVGFLALFLELACIRWFAANVVFLQFFTNVVLIASFLGLSCGCLAARSQRHWLSLFPALILLAALAARFSLLVYFNWEGVAVDVGHQGSPQEVFFGAEYRSPDAAEFVVPIEAIAAFFFLLVALPFVGLGQVLGRALASAENHVLAYSLNIGGSLAGIAAFSALSFLETPPLLWFAIVFAGVAVLLWRGGALTRLRLGALAATLLAVAIPADVGGGQARWSPYYAVDYRPERSYIWVDNIGHQAIVPFDEGGSVYSLIHLLQRQSGGAPFKNVLVIGAGAGNDVAHALRFGAASIDAVEIDPVIQDIGSLHNPDRPYQDSRVRVHIDDGRHLLRNAEGRYDLVVYALVNSLVQHSGYADLRLESLLFTEQAFADVRRALKPGGVFVMYNYFRQGWVVQRVAAMAAQAFGCPPTVLSLPYVASLKASDPAGFTAIVAGCDNKIAPTLAARGVFWLNGLPPANVSADGFTALPVGSPLETQGLWQPIAPTSLVIDSPAAETRVTDDWPFLYVSGRLVPDLIGRSIALMSAVGLGMVFLFAPKDGLRPKSRMFFLGAAFMLLEARAVVAMALLFGATWVVNSAVFFTTLSLALAANVYVLKTRSVRLWQAYAGLAALLIVSASTPIDVFLSGPLLWRFGAPCLLTLGPLLFAAAIFARAFGEETEPDQALGWNVAGSVIGGMAESLSTVVGFQRLALVAMALYALSLWTPRTSVGAR